MMNDRTENIDETVMEGSDSNNNDAVGPTMPESESSNATPQTKEPKERAGTVLKRAREHQGLSLEIVHEATKIPMDALRAIEEGYTIRMLSPFYYSGFVKMYAHYLNVDVSEVIEEYKPEELPKHIERDVEEFEIPKWVTEIFTRKRKQQIVMAAGALFAVFLFLKISSFLMPLKPQMPVPKNTVKIKAVKKEIKKVAAEPRRAIQKQTPKIITPRRAPKVVTIPILKSVKPVASIVPAITAQKEISLTVRASQNSWLRVKTDGMIVFQSTLRIGDVETWSADHEIEISGRNINQLEFELNGKMIGKLGRNDRNAKKVVITKNGLSVK